MARIGCMNASDSENSRCFEQILQISTRFSPIYTSSRGGHQVLRVVFLVGFCEPLSVPSGARLPDLCRIDASHDMNCQRLTRRDFVW